MSAPRPGRLAPALALLLVAAAAGCGRSGPAPHGPNVLLIVVDTLRADRLTSRTMPALDRFAQGALRCSHAESPRAKTTPAVASLLTGLYPHDHGARDLTTPLPEPVPTLAEAFQRAGWTTAAIVGNFVLRHDFTRLSRGFDTWVDDLPDASGVPPDDVPQRRARSLTDGALVALGLQPPPAAPAAEPGRPWFLYLHYMDPHGAYDPPAEHRLFGGGAPDFIPSADSLPPDPLHT